VYGEDMGGAARGVADSGQADAAGAAAEGHARLATIAVEEETGPAPGSETGTIRVVTEPGADPAKDQYRLKRSEEHTSELQSRFELVCRLLLEKKKEKI